jgi:hypothetical protein
VIDKKAVLRKRCTEDLKFLVTEVLGLKRWSDELHGSLASHLEAPGDRKLVLLPRGHQKSTIISVCWLIQQLLRNPNETVGLYSATWKLSKDLLHQIKNILVTSPLKDLFGSFQSSEGRWTIEQIDIAQKNAILTKDPTISTGGIDTGKTGSHCSLMIFDDPVTPENTTTPEQVRKTIESYKDCLPLLNPGGRIIVIGTRYTMGDLYGDLIENEARSINGKVFETEEQRKEWRKLLNL